jgi:hypothetical protein
MRGVHSNRGSCLTHLPGSCLTRQPEAVMAVTVREGVSRRSGGEWEVRRGDGWVAFPGDLRPEPNEHVSAACASALGADRRFWACVPPALPALYLCTMRE